MKKSMIICLLFFVFSIITYACIEKTVLWKCTGCDHREISGTATMEPCFNPCRGTYYVEAKSYTEVAYCNCCP